MISPSFRRYLARSGALLVVGLWLLFLPGIAQSAEKRVAWDRMDVTIQVHEDGSFTVEEVMQVRFEGGPFTYGYRKIPADRLESVDGIQVWDEDGPYQQSDEAAGRHFVVDEGPGAVGITWFFPEVQDTTRTFRLRYRVHGGLRIYEGGDQLWWKAIFPDRDSAIAEATVTVIAPAKITLSRAYYVQAEMEQVDDRTVRFHVLEPVPPQVPFEVRVQWPHGAVTATPPDWQLAEDALLLRKQQQAQQEAIARLVIMLGSIVFVLVGFLVLLLIWYFFGRDKGGMSVTYLAEPPSDLPPALAGQLLDVFIKPRHTLATILDLANRGVLTIEELPKRKHQSGDVRYRLVAGFPKRLAKFERLTLRGFMGRSQEKTLSDVKKRFYKHIGKIGDAQEEALMKMGFFPKPPSQIIPYFTWVGNTLWVAGALVIVLTLADVFRRWGVRSQSIMLWPTFSLFLVGLGIHASKRYVVPRTASGRAEAARWRAFRRYLLELKKMKNVPPAQEILAKYLPYAVAFGVEKAFLSAWSRGPGANWMPEWYLPWDGEMAAGEEAVSAGHEASGERISSRGLSHASRYLAASLEEMSKGLAETLTLASGGSASGGIGGDSGFSGGGDDFGGGGGGGSGGFG